MRNELLARSGANGISAVKSDRVYVMDWDVLNGLDQIVGVTYLAKLLHPEVDLDPVAVHKEYLDRLGLEYPGRGHSYTRSFPAKNDLHSLYIENHSFLLFWSFPFRTLEG